MRLLLVALLTLVWVTTAQSQMPDLSGRVVLTVGGDLGISNGPGAFEDDVNFFGYLDLEYEKSMRFDDAMLASMPQKQIKAKLLDTGREITYSGPLLSDVMKASGVEGRTAVPTAFDGYQAEITWTNIQQYQPIVATHADGVPLDVGKLGPVMIVFPVVADQEVYDSFEAMQVWAMFFLSVE